MKLQWDEAGDVRGRGERRADLAAPRCPVLLGMVCAPGWLPNCYLQIYDEAGTEWRVSFYCNLIVILCLLNLVFLMSFYSFFKQFSFI